MSHAAAGEADEAWMQVGKRLRQVGTQAVLMALECILRKKGNHIEMQCPHRLRLEREDGGTHVGIRRQHRLLFLPLFGGHIDGRAAISRPVWSSRQTTTLPPLLPGATRAKREKSYFSPFFKLMPSKPSFCNVTPGRASNTA